MIQKFLKKKNIETSDDLRLQTELFAYRVAKHYNISLMEVNQMDIKTFQQSLSWALALDGEQEKQNEKDRVSSQTNNETISLDYGFLSEEGL
tara:strand:+ start:1789 stop:2064 length:276 start_codon:yes stop_codon:yes gene_type:complete